MRMTPSGPRDGCQARYFYRLDGRDVFSAATKQKIATVREGNLYSLMGEPLNLSLELLEGGELHGISVERQADAVARFKRLAGGA